MKVSRVVGYLLCGMILAAGILLFIGNNALAEDVTITTYYPAPYGVYTDLYASIYYDQEDNTYQLNGNGTSYFHEVDIDGYIAAPGYVDRDDSNYYVDANGLARLNDVTIDKLNITGSSTKPAGSTFVQPHPSDPEKEINYVMFEGRDTRIFFDGVAILNDGEATIEVPEDFRLAASKEEPINVILTPFADAKIWVKRRSLEQILVKSKDGSNIEFGYLVIAAKAGFEDSMPIQENAHFKTSKTITLKGFEERFKVRETDSHYGKLARELNRKLLILNHILNKDGKVNIEMVNKLGWEYRKEKLTEKEK